MPRRRARKDYTYQVPYQKEEQITKKQIEKRRMVIDKKKAFFAISLIAVFFLVLFFNAYFNFTSNAAFNDEGTTLGTKYYLSGPDPYYNMRLCEKTLENGVYPYVTEKDPLLNYPVTRGTARPPLFNIIAVATASILSSSMEQLDALGMAMQWLPAIYGALLVFPIYGIGKELFNRKVGLLAALLIPLIPIHIASGHGSAFSLFDHDSFLLLMSTAFLFFIIRSFKSKDTKLTILYAALGGICIGAIELSWVAAEFFFVVTIVGMIVVMFFDIIKGKMSTKTPLTFITTLSVAFLITLPYVLTIGEWIDFPLYTVLFALGASGLYLFIKRINLPWIVTIPAVFVIAGIGAVFLLFVNQDIILIEGAIGGPISRIADILYGSGIYGTKVSLTIAEAHTFNISRSVMSFGAAIYWIALAGFVFFLWKTYKINWKAENLFIMMIFIVNMWLLSTAGRFINDLVPLMVIFAAAIIWMVVDKVDYKRMIRSIRNAGGGLRGIRKGVKITHIGGIAFVSLLIVLPNAFMSLDAAVPLGEQKAEYFGNEHGHAFGISLYKEMYWSDACDWLAQQDTEIEDPAKRPGFISWWDYGFYEASMGGHPTVADNYQSGIEPAANFHTSKTEEEAIAVLIIRLSEVMDRETFEDKETFIENLTSIFYKYLPDYNETRHEYDDEGNITRTWNITRTPASDLINIITDPKQYAHSFDELIEPEWNNTVFRTTLTNAKYHDATEILLNLTDEELTMMYMDVQNASGGYSIRYYGVEGYDAVNIFSVFAFLSDKSVHGFATTEDDYFKTAYVDKNGGEHTLEELEAMTLDERNNLAPFNPTTTKKDAYFDTMVYKVYYGWYGGGGEFPQYSVPTYFLRHFVPVFTSFTSPRPLAYLQNIPAVVIAKYYEGAWINGKVMVEGTIPYNGASVLVHDELLGVPHDATTVGTDGSFKILVPAGNISLNVYLGNTDLGEMIVFNTTENPPITEEEAMRRVQSNRSVEINISYAAVEGTINGTENESFVNLFMTNEYYPGTTEYTETIYDGKFSFTDLIPSLYRFRVTNETDVELFNTTTFLMPNNNTFNITASYPPYKPKIVNVTLEDDNGTVELYPDDSVNLTLDIYLDDNYTWNVSGYDYDILPLLERIDNSSWEFYANTTGETSIEATYYKIENVTDIARTFKVDIIVRPLP